MRLVVIWSMDAFSIRQLLWRGPALRLQRCHLGAQRRDIGDGGTDVCRNLLLRSR